MFQQRTERRGFPPQRWGGLRTEMGWDKGGNRGMMGEGRDRRRWGGGRGGWRGKVGGESTL